MFFFLGLYRQYDTMICPRSEKVARIIDQCSNQVKKQEDEVLIIPPAHKMREMCMECFLVPSRDIFIYGDFYSSYDVSKATNGIVHLYSCCYTQKVCFGGKLSTTIYTSPIESLKEVSIMHIIFTNFQSMYGMTSV